MAAGEKFSSSDNSESKDSDSGAKKSSKRVVRAPLGSSAETPSPQAEDQGPKRLFDIVQRQLQEQRERQPTDQETPDFDKKKSKKDKKKGEAEPAESTKPSTELAQPEVEQTDTQLEPIDTETESSEGEKPVADGAVEIALDDTIEEEVALSDRVKEWNRTRPQSPPTAPMSEVGQPTVVPEEVSPPEAAVPEVPVSAEAEQEVKPEAATAEVVPVTALEAAPEQRAEQVDEAPAALPVFDWQPQPQLQHQAETRSWGSAPEEKPVTAEVAETEVAPPQPTYPEAAVSGDTHMPAHNNPLFTQQGVDPALTHRQAQELAAAPAAPTVIERTVHHRPSDFWPGVLVGGAVEHIRHKRRERKMEKSQKLQQSRIAQLEYTQRRTALEQQTEANERLRAEHAARYKTPTEKPAAATEAFPMPMVAEHSPEQSKIEQSKAEQQPKQPLPEQPGVATEEVKPLEGHHIEKSTWHKIEVDDRTGQVAENSNIVYGEAFQRERRPEQVAALQAQQQAEADEQEQAAMHAIGMPTLPRPQTGSSGPTETQPTAPRSVRPTPPIQRRSKVVRPVFMQSSADMALWGGLVLVVLAIIAALAL